MKRSDLEAMGLTTEQVNAIMATNGSDIENAKSTLQAEIDGLNGQIKDRDKQLTDLKKTAGDNEALTKQISDLQEANKKAAESHETEMNQLKLDFAIDKALTGASARNNKAVKALLDLEDAKFDKDGNVKGLQEQIDKLKADESTKFLFNSEPDQSQGQGQNNAQGPAAFSGFQPGQSTNIPDSKQTGYETRLAEARKNGNTVEAIKIKQEAAANGVILS